MDLLTCLAVLPGLFLVWYVYRQDKIEKEPTGLLLRLLMWGGLTVFVAMFVEMGLVEVDKLFFDEKSTAFLLVENFLCVALVEEYVKYRVLKKTWTNPAFDYCFDGIVYAVCASMGFAILENIFYVFENGVDVAIVRAITSLPGHCIFGIYMGYYYGIAKMKAVQGDNSGMSWSLKQALWVPTLLHGFYDYCLSGNDEMLMLAFLVFVIALDFKAYKKLKEASLGDHHF